MGNGHVIISHTLSKKDTLALASKKHFVSFWGAVFNAVFICSLVSVWKRPDRINDLLNCKQAK